MKLIRIAMWSGPRNISTALMRSFENRKDTTVVDEPFYACYLKTTKLNHPMRKEILNSQDTNWDRVANLCSNKTFKGFMIFYQKHMSHHLVEKMDLNWLKKVKNCILIRNPKFVINSYVKKYDIKDIRQLGYLQQLEILNFLKKQKLEDPIIIDSSDIINNPKHMLKKLCNKLNINFTDQMLSWPKGGRDSDGVWASYWYKNVFKSKGFIRAKEKKVNLNKKLYGFYKDCMKHYKVLYDKRIQP